MKIVIVLLGAVVSGIVLGQSLSARSFGIVNQGVVEDGQNLDFLTRRYYHRSSQEARQLVSGSARTDHDHDGLQVRGAKAMPMSFPEASPNVLAGLKKMVSANLQKQGPKITKFAHTALQKQLNRFMGPKQKGKEKGDKKSEKGGGKNDEKNTNEKEPGKKTRGLFESRSEPTGPGVFARLGDHFVNHREEYLDTLMTLHGMAQQGAGFLEPERMLMGYD